MCDAANASGAAQMALRGAPEGDPMRCMWMTMVNHGYVHFTLNFLAALRRHEVEMRLLILCTDDAAFTALAGPSTAAGCTAIRFDVPGAAALPAGLTLWGESEYRRVVFAKLDAMRHVLHTFARPAGVGVLAFIDMDIIVRADPTPHFLRVMDAQPDVSLVMQCDEGGELAECSNAALCPNPCSGIMAIRVCDGAVDALLQYAPADVEAFSSDQAYLRARADARGVRRLTLPRSILPNGAYVGYTPDATDTARLLSPTPLPAEACLLHFNWLRNTEKEAAMQARSMWYIGAAAPRKRVGITVHGSSAFANGCIQNAYLLKLCFEAGGFEVDLLGVSSAAGSAFDVGSAPIINMDAPAFRYSAYAAIVAATRQLTSIQAAKLTAAGGKLIDFDCGPSFALHTEQVAYKRASPAFFEADAHPKGAVTWLIEPFRAFQAYMGAIKRHPVVLVPHVWSPSILRAKLGDAGLERLRYVPRPPTTRTLEVIIMEPNIGWTKTALVPLVACDVLNERYGDTLSAVHVFGASDEFKERIVQHLRVAPKVRTYPRVPATIVYEQFAGRLFSHVALLCHQVDHPRNYLYYEALYLGFPLVHNSPALPDCGYPYDEYDVNMAAGALACVARGVAPPQGWDAHAKATAALLHSLDPLAEDNVRLFGDLLRHEM